MLRSELVELLCTHYPETPRQTVEAAVKLVFSEITQAVARGDRVELRNFGTFFASNLKPTMGHNPKTGEALWLGKRRAVRFKAGVNVRASLNCDDSEFEDRSELVDATRLSVAS
jgi:integration host factor subunit beta